VPHDDTATQSAVVVVGEEVDVGPSVEDVVEDEVVPAVVDVVLPEPPAVLQAPSRQPARAARASTCNFGRVFTEPS
jgi:hypothetical protein